MKNHHSKPKSDIRRAVQSRIDDESPASKGQRRQLRRDNQERAQPPSPQASQSRATAAASVPSVVQEKLEYPFTKGISFINDGVAYGELIQEVLRGIEVGEFSRSVRRTRSGRTVTSPEAQNAREKSRGEKS